MASTNEEVEFDWDDWSTEVAPYQKPSEMSPRSPRSTETPPRSSRSTETPPRSPRSTNGLRDNAEFDRDTSQSSSPPVTPLKTQSLSRFRKSCVSFLLLVLALVVGVLGYLVLQLNITDHHPHEIDCLWILSSASSLDSFPLPYPVDKRTHEDLLKELFPGMLDNLVRTRSDVCSNLTAEIQKFNQHLAKASKILTCSDSEYTEVAFYTDITVAREQLSLADSQINSLANLYYGVRTAYYTLNATAAKALDKNRLSNQKEFYCYAQSWGLLWFGVDADRWYCVPWRERLRKMEEVRSGIIVLEREIQRLEQIEQVVQEVKRILQDLAASLLQWQIEFTMQIRRKVNVVKPRGPRNSIQKRLREWLRQHFVHNRRLKEIWSELLTSIDKREQKFVIEITTEWCKRLKT